MMTRSPRKVRKIMPPGNREVYRDGLKLCVSNGFAWPRNTMGAVSLTYDDGLSNHLDRVAPELESANLRGTFYPHISSNDFSKRVDEWGDLAGRGHELGNHTVFHPCLDRHALDPDFDLADYGETRWRREIELANWVLSRLDGRTERTFGNTCWDNWIGPRENRICIERLAPDYFKSVRGEMSRRGVDPERFTPYNLGTLPGDGYSFEGLRDIINQEVEYGRWLIITFHCVGDEYDLYIDEREHRRLLKWLFDESGRVWTAPLKEVSDHLIGCCETSND